MAAVDAGYAHERVSLAWLLSAATAGFEDASTERVLSPAENERARQVLPPSFFGWMLEQTETTVGVVRELNEGDGRVPYSDVARVSGRILTELGFRLAHDRSDESLLEIPHRLAGQAARLGVDAALVVQSMRVMEQRWVKHLLSFASDRAAEVAPRILAASAAVYDAVVDGFVADYANEHIRIASEVVANKRALIETILEPAAREPDGFDELGIDLSAHHLAFVLWFRTAGVTSQLESLARHLGARSTANSLLTIPGQDHDLWGWLTFAAEPDAIVLERIRGVDRDTSKIGLAIGPFASGIEGFRRTHLLSREYSATARRLPAAHAPVFADAESMSYLSLLLRDREQAEWFIATELGELGTGSSAADSETRETLRIYLETGQSLAETARRLRIHRNTVVYRLRRVEQSIGRPVATRRHELYAAALLAHLLSRPVA